MPQLGSRSKSSLWWGFFFPLFSFPSFQIFPSVRRWLWGGAANPEPPCAPASCKRYPSLPPRAGSARQPGDHRQRGPSAPVPAPGNRPGTDARRWCPLAQSRAQSTRGGEGGRDPGPGAGGTAVCWGCSHGGCGDPLNPTHVHGAASVVPKHPQLGWCHETHFHASTFNAHPLRPGAWETLSPLCLCSELFRWEIFPEGEGSRLGWLRAARQAALQGGSRREMGAQGALGGLWWVGL